MICTICKSEKHRAHSCKNRVGNGETVLRRPIDWDAVEQRRKETEKAEKVAAAWAEYCANTTNWELWGE